MIRIVLADDHQILRSGLVKMIDAEEDMEIIGEAESGREAVSLCARLNPDIAILDYDMPDMDGLEATRIICGKQPGVKVLVLTMYDQPEIAARFTAAGAVGFLPKKSSFDEMKFAIRKVFAGASFLTSSVSAPGASSADSIKGLSEREFQVFQLLADGKSMNEISDEINIGYNTVKTYKYRIFSKLKVQRVADLTKLAIRNNLLKKA